MTDILSSKDITNIKIYLSKRINSEEFWLDINSNLIPPEEVNYINRVNLYNKYCEEFLSIKYPEIINNSYYKSLMLSFIDMAIIKFYFVKYNKIILKSKASTNVLTQNFKGPEYYSFMKDIRYMIKSSDNNSTNSKAVPPATEKQFRLMFRLLIDKPFLKFDYSKKQELSIEECSAIISYLHGKKDFINMNIIDKYFKTIHFDPLYSFIVNPTVKDTIKKMIFSFLLNQECFTKNNLLVSQDEANQIDRISLASDFYKSNFESLKEYIENKNKSDFIIDSANYIDKIIPKVYYILYNNLYNNESFEEKDLKEFDHLKYEYTMNLKFQFNSLKNNKSTVNYYASSKQINFIYVLLNKNSMSLVLKDEKKLLSKDASRIINMLKDNRLALEYKNKFFEEKLN